MTIYGGEKTTWGATRDGFLVLCTKCGWHSLVEVSPNEDHGNPIVEFCCKHCGNTYTEG